MVENRLILLLGLSVLYAEGLYITGDKEQGPLYIQVYKKNDNIGPARLTRQNIEYKKSVRIQPDQTVIVVPNPGSVLRQPYGYGTYGTSANRGPTVIVNTPAEYNRLITSPYGRY